MSGGAGGHQLRDASSGLLSDEGSSQTRIVNSKARGCWAEPRPWLPGSSRDSSPNNCCPCETISSGGANLIFLRKDGKAKFPPLSRLSVK